MGARTPDSGVTGGAAGFAVGPEGTGEGAVGFTAFFVAMHSAM